MSETPEMKDDPQLSFATFEQLIDELGSRCDSLLVVCNRMERNSSVDCLLDIFRRNTLATHAMGLAEYAKQRMYEELIHVARKEE